MSKPREFWLVENQWNIRTVNGIAHDICPNQIHVIEYSAYKDIWKVSKMMEANYLDAKKENAMMREALKGLLSDTQHSDHDCGDKDCPVYIARKTLAKLKKDNDPTLGTVITEL